VDHLDHQASVDATGNNGGVVIQLRPNRLNIFESEFDWLFSVIERRLDNYFHNKSWEQVSPPPVFDTENRYHRFIHSARLTDDERLVLLLAMAPHVRPQMLDVFFTRNKETQRGFAEFGGHQGKAHSGFLPTVETALFILAGQDLNKRFELMALFGPDHVFYREKVLQLTEIAPDEPPGAWRIDMGEDFLHHSLYGRSLHPQFGPGFPARQLITRHRWDELVLDPYTHEQLEELKAWLQHGDTLMKTWGLERKLMPGYRCLFHGPPGTGKSLTAALLGQVSGRRVYGIDLSLIISKYIGETEKNLEKVFIQAEEKNWLLFFDEADALFGKRTQVNDSHDRFANQETSYLLQRVELFPGVVILATNLKSNIDEAFARRFQAVIHFPMPDKKLRYQLWQQSFSPMTHLAETIDLKEIAARFELSGGAIMNVVRYSSLMALNRHSSEITFEDLEHGILREFNKEGRSAE
jgi:hypothetical protein